MVVVRPAEVVVYMVMLQKAAQVGRLGFEHHMVCRRGTKEHMYDSRAIVEGFNHRFFHGVLPRSDHALGAAHTPEQMS